MTRVAFTARAVELIRENSGTDGTLARDVRVRVEFACAVWIVDAGDCVRRDDITLPRGCGMGDIEGIVALYVRDTREGVDTGAWRMPPLSTAYLCDDGRVRTIGQMLEGMPAELVPCDERTLMDMLLRFGVDWTSPLVPTPYTHGALKHASLQLVN